MGRLTGSDISQYNAGSSDGNKNLKKINFLSLKDNGDTAKIRFLYDSVEDIEGYSVHRVQVGDRERYVECLRANKLSPIDDCPFCREGKEPGNEKIDGYKSKSRIWIPVFNEKANEVQIWERPGSFYDKLSNYCSRYSPVVSQVFDVVRRGAKGYQKTDYDLFPVGSSDGTTIDDILDDCDMDDLPKIRGRFVLQKSADDMEYYLRNREFPDADAEPQVRRRNRGSESDDLPFEVDDGMPTRNERRRGRGDRY